MALSRFFIADGKLQADKTDGPVSAEEAVTLALLQLCQTADDIDDRLKSIEWALTEGEIKVHRTQ